MINVNTCDHITHLAIQSLSDFMTTIGQGPNSHKIQLVTESNKATVRGDKCGRGQTLY